ncbi:hypothetical protein ACHAW5_008967 [Stephanodiscus triporus]|uniref:DNA (cytosine-5-)-methyltransferase n=1 Tax=Stephanodiscus triporus TaxID=2934178 RepID=A0ABD3NPS4_9STRA
MWMKLDHTFIEQDRAAGAKENLGCDWPTIYYTESGPSSLPAYFEKYGGPTIPQKNTGRPIALDIFAGGGGMSIGLERAGWNVKYKVDMNAACCETLEMNFEGKSVFKEDVAKFLRKLKLGKLNIDTQNIALIHGSPPCQGFSMANTSGGKNDWQNKQCTLDFLEVIEFIQPPFVSMENVPGIVSKRKINQANSDNKSYLQTVVGKLLSMGYNWLLLLASKDGYELPEAPRQTHGVPGTDSPRIVTVHDVLHDLEEIAPNSAGDVKLNGKTVCAHFSDGAEIANISDNDIRLRSDFPLMAPDEPAKTVRKKNKYLTPLECKRLMSFPDNHVICGRNQSEIRDQIGNAVPCRFAEAIGKTIMESYCMGKYGLPSNDA